MPLLKHNKPLVRIKKLEIEVAPASLHEQYQLFADAIAVNPDFLRVIMIGFLTEKRVK